MLSRVADSVFWLARYMERTNGMLRMLRTNYISSQDEVKDFTWKVLLANYSDASKEKLKTLETNSSKVLEHLLLDKTNSGSIFTSITRARENGRAVQDHISKEVWQCLNDYYHLIRDKDLQLLITHGDPVTALDKLIHHGLFYYGTVDATMSRDEGFNYLNIGKFLERAIVSLDMLTIKLTEIDFTSTHPAEVPALRYLLYSLSGYEFYLKTHRGNFQADQVLQQVLLNEHFPHSVYYSLKQIARYFERLETESLPDSYSQLDFLIGKTMNNVKYSTISLSKSYELKKFLKETRNELVSIAAALNKYYFGNS